MATGRRTRHRSSAPTQRARTRPADRDLLEVLARTVRNVEQAVARSQVRPSTRASFQAAALLLREERDRLQTAAMPQSRRTEQQKKIDLVATAMARTAARNHTFLALLADDAPLLPDTPVLMREMRQAAGIEEQQQPVVAEAPVDEERPASRQVVPRSVVSRQLANPFLEPDFSAPLPTKARPRLLAGWDLLEPLLRAFEQASSGAPSCMRLPEPWTLATPGGLELMPHQGQVVAAVEEGHRTFLLADEPGLGKTAQALLAAHAANAYPLLVVVPNVVKTSWAREVSLWTPQRAVTVVHSDGETVDAFADIVVVNYELLDRHVGWLGDLGFRGMVVDEAHFIKNKTSLRSRHVLELSRRVRERTVRPLLMALTGTPLINDIEDFLAIWEFLGWITPSDPGPVLTHALEDNGFTPAETEFYPAARSAVIDLGIVRRRKVDVAADIPSRRIADLPVELEGAVGRSIQQAEQALVRRLLRRYDSLAAARGEQLVGIDEALVRQVAAWERQEGSETSDGNVFSLLRRIGQAKASLAADFAAQLSHNAGKVVFFAKHVDVMDTAERVLAQRGLRSTSVRGDQTARARQQAIDAFTNDPDVSVIVCSLTAAGVGLNLQVASNVVLAELSWTAAEQTQAIDRVHRIGQDQPVTAWRVIAAQTVDARITDLIDRKAGLAARSLDGSDEEVASSVDVQLEALVGLLTDALVARG